MRTTEKGDGVQMQMTTEQLSEAIARAKEPKPSDDYAESVHICGRYLSRLGWWESFGFEAVAIGEYRRTKWCARSITEFESPLSMLLLKELLELGYEVSIDQQAGNRFEMTCWTWQSGQVEFKTPAEALEEAIALAWLKAHGIE